MKLLCCLVLPICLGVARAQAPASIAIFDGRSLQGWEGNPQLWRVEDGAITAEIPAGESLRRNEFLHWNGEVHDFELTLEFRIFGGPAANSGVQFRSQRRPDGQAAGYQADIDNGATWLGRIYDEHGRALLVERGSHVSISPDGRRWSEEFAQPGDLRPLVGEGSWNTYRIIGRGPHMELWVNGARWSSLDDHQSDGADYSGKIALQLHSGQGPAKVQFRNLRLTHLGRTELPPARAVTPPVEAPPIKPVGADGKSLNLDFETGTLTGWTAEGEAWARQPVSMADRASRRAVPLREDGNYWIGWHPEVGDDPTGTLTSAVFPVIHRWGGFLVSGGSGKGVRVEIVNADTGSIIKRASGADVEQFRRELVDLAGVKRIFVRLVDEVSGRWGHIRFDDFVFYADKPVFADVHEGDPARPFESPVLWHLRPNAARPTAIANPSAQKVVSSMLLTHGFQAELIAAEPDVHQPIAFAIDVRGRLWVVEGHSYPSKQPPGQGKDRIVIFEDRDGDGSFETRKVFMERLNLVSGIEVGFGGVWVGAAPEFLFIPDRNHDDRPDGPPQVLLDGWGYQDTHETLNSFTWGPDGWLYGNQGVFVRSAIGKPGTPRGQRQHLRAGVWRYHPIRHEFEIFSHGGSNQWGIDFNEHGHLFLTHCRSFHGGGGTTFAIRNGHYWNQANSHHAEFISNSAPDFAPALKNFLPAAARYDSGEGGAGKPGSRAIYGGHSHVGTMIYLGDNWPDIYRDHLFTHNLHGHQMNHQVNVRSGSAYETYHAGYDILHAPDPSYVAVDLQTGPDGAVYVIDWTDRRHCHSPHEDRWDRTNGRIYRVSWAATYKPLKVDLRAKTDAELAALHRHKSAWYARTARRLLQERAASGRVAPEAIASLHDLREADDASLALRALWTLHNIGALDHAALARMFTHPDEAVRAWAVQLATERPEAPRASSAVLARLARHDSSALVRLAVASALPAIPPAERWDIVSALAAHGEDAGDRYLPRMLWFGLAGVVREDVDRAMAIAENTPLSSLADSIHWYVARTPRGREAIAARLAKLPDAAAERGLRLFAFSLQNESKLPMPPAWVRAAARFAQASDAGVRALADQLSAAFGDRAVLTRMRAQLADSSLPLPERQRAFQVLKRAGDREAIPQYIALLEHDAFRSQVIPLLSGTDDPAAAAGILRHFPKLDDDDRLAALNTLTSRPAQALALLDAMEAGAIAKRDVTALHIRQMRNLSDPRVNQQLDRVWGRVGESSADAKAAIARLKKAYDAAPLWAYSASAGQEVYQRVCIACHSRDGKDANLGPDLSGSWRNGVDYFLENIIDPNAVVGADFQLNIITKKDGTVISGMVEKQTDTSLIVRTTDGNLAVPLADIKERQVSPQSLMPSGLLETLTEREAIELLKYLTTRT